jgi:short-subunit dehydrogenase
MDKMLESDFPYADGILNGKNALVCGASKGIGKATALMLSESRGSGHSLCKVIRMN